MSIQCSGQHKTRLLVGEGNFSFTEAMIKKHDEKAKHDQATSLARAVIATEWKLAEKIQEERTLERIKNLEGLGVRIFFGVDGTKLDQFPQFTGRKFSRIHWNCPHDGSDYKQQTLPKILEKFFEACAKLQENNGRVHVTLAQPNKEKFFYQGYCYSIGNAATRSGYVLIRKRKFEKERYPEYRHTQTNKKIRASVTDEGLREFVFQKVDEAFFRTTKEAHTINLKGGKTVLKLEKLGKDLSKVSEKKYTISLKDVYYATEFVQIGDDEYAPYEYQVERLCFECSSDDESSDYENNS